MKSEILNSIQWFSTFSTVPPEQAGALPTNSHERKGGKKLRGSRQVEAISDLQTGSRLEIVALMACAPRMVTELELFPSVSLWESNSKE